MATRLARLRQDLERLRLKRLQIRHGTGWAGLVNALAVILAVAFLADWGLDMSRPQRLILLLLVIGAAVWAFRRFTLPLLRQHEDLLEVALMVERQQRIDSDLVAALQFEQPEALQWGSPQLEQAVVAQVAELSPRINVAEGLPLESLKRRVTGALLVVAVLAGGGVLYPDYMAAFLTRMLLGEARYPTRTRLLTVSVNGTATLEAGRKTAALIRCPISHSVVFEVQADRFIPESGSGQVRITSQDGSVATEVPLVKSEAVTGLIEPDSSLRDASAAAAGRLVAVDHPVMFRGELPRLMDSVSFTVHLGDAISLPVVIEAIPLPVVEVTYEVTPPDYARHAHQPASDAGFQRQLAVVEGSSVTFRVKCINKNLAGAALWLGGMEYRLCPHETALNDWVLNPAGTPLAAVSKPLEYRLEVADEQGLSPDVPLRGTIKLRTDHPPRLAVSVRTRKVIPTAAPPVNWSVSDDFGLSRIALLVQVTREDGTVEEKEVEVARTRVEKPLGASAGGTYRLELPPFRLTKGDEIKLTLTATDFRGGQEPKRSFSEPIILQVTDQQGILSGLLETDQESAKQLDAIIRRELGIGDK